MSDSVLDRIRQNRQRKEVTHQSDTLIDGTQPEEKATESVQAVEEVPESKPIKSKPVESRPVRDKPAPDTTPPSDPLQELRAALAQIPETQRHSAIGLEKELDQISHATARTIALPLRFF